MNGGGHAKPAIACDLLAVAQVGSRGFGHAALALPSGVRRPIPDHAVSGVSTDCREQSEL